MTRAKKAPLAAQPLGAPSCTHRSTARHRERHKHHCGMQMPFLISHQFASHGFPRRLGTNEPIPNTPALDKQQPALGEDGLGQLIHQEFSNLLISVT